MGFTSTIDIAANYHHIQFQGNLLFQIKENGRKPHFNPDLGSLGPNLGRQTFFIKLIVAHSSNLSSNAI